MSREAPPDRPELEVEENVARASTLPSSIYTDPAIFERQRERVFARSWQWAADRDAVRVPGRVHPFSFLEGCLDEPLLLTRDADDRLHCLANVCTHRGNLLVEQPGQLARLRCRYHGRRFGLDGRFLSMPEFEQAEGFPRPEDDLARVRFGEWGRFLFTSLDPAFELDEWLAPVDQRLGWLDWSRFVFDPARSRDYLVKANWALYCDNYLEGFHIPYVHAGLAEALDYGSYRTELFALGNLQLGIAEGGEETFDLPPGSPDHGSEVAAYYFWLFPNLMLNFYPWGLSLNLVQPLAIDRTRVRFLAWVADPSKLDRGAGAGLDRVEREDEAIVEAVQRGVGSRFYRQGRFSPAREAGVHQFHRLLARFLYGSR